MKIFSRTFSWKSFLFCKNSNQHNLFCYTTNTHQLSVGEKILKMEPSTAAVVNRENSVKIIKEGQAEICVKSEKVFYNPVQEFNRDLSIAVLSTFIDDYKAEKLAKAEQKAKNKCNTVQNEQQSVVDTEIEVSILEALSATGLRSIRYAKEIPSVTKIVANDLSEQAVETIKSNVVHNNVEDIIETSHDDACMLMYKHKHPAKRFAAIDLDPYGCPSIFLDAAVQSVQDGGLLLVTATDMAVLAGNSPETCYCKYGAISLKSKCCHEMALRILLQCIEQHANRYSRYIVPLLSVSVDFYIRVFVKIYSGAIHCKKTTSKLSMVYQCVGCETLTLQPLGGFKPNPTDKNPHQEKAYLPHGPPVAASCEHCGQAHRLGGPVWSSSIHDERFVERVLARVERGEAGADGAGRLGTARRLAGVLAMVREELPDAPLYYTLDRLCARAHLEIMPMMLMRSALLNAGYAVSYSHASRASLKTSAPPRLLWDVVRAWARDHPPGADRLSRDPVAARLLAAPAQHAVQLQARADAEPPSRAARRLRFQYNPAPHWGPGARAAINVGEGKMSKAERNQNKSRRDGSGAGEKRKRRDADDDDEEGRKRRDADDEEGCKRRNADDEEARKRRDGDADDEEGRKRRNADDEEVRKRRDGDADDEEGRKRRNADDEEARKRRDGDADDEEGRKRRNADDEEARKRRNADDEEGRKRKDGDDAGAACK